MRFPFMKRSLGLLLGLVLPLMLAVGLVFSAVIARNVSALTYDAFFIAPDAQGVNQVWGLTLPNGEAKVLTHAPQRIYTYAISPDQTQIAYFSSEAVWLQTLKGEDVPQTLIAVEQEFHYVALVFSPDAQTVAYSDDGLWLLDIKTKQTKQLLQDIPWSATSGPDYYFPHFFIDSDHLVVDIAYGEGDNRGIYTLSTQALQFILTECDAELGVLSDGRAMIYGSSCMGPNSAPRPLIGEFSKEPQTSPFFKPFIEEKFKAQGMTDYSLDDIVETTPGHLRFIGMKPAAQGWPYGEWILGEYDFVTEILTFDTSEITTQALALASFRIFSPDGHYLAGYDYRDDNNMIEILRILDLETKTLVVLPVDHLVTHFQWAGNGRLGVKHIWGMIQP